MLNTHNNPKLTEDTASSVDTWMTKDILVLVDGAGWKHFDNINFPYPLYRGLVHGHQSSPFRNILHGMVEIYNRFNADWYCYLESDCLVVSRGFEQDLRQNISKWIGGTNYHKDTRVGDLPVLNDVIGGQLTDWHYLLGAVLFFSRDYMQTLMFHNIPKKLIEVTENLPSGEFPDFEEYAFEEQLFISLANYYKPDSYFNLGSWNNYNVRFEPDVKPSEVTPSSPIIHPLKDFNSPVRKHFREFRNRLKNDRRSTNSRV